MGGIQTRSIKLLPECIQRIKKMKIVAPNSEPFLDPNKIKVVKFLEKNLNEKNISFNQLRARLQIKISDKRLHRICIDAGYGVIK